MAEAGIDRSFNHCDAARCSAAIGSLAVAQKAQGRGKKSSTR
jgi:hypothetical protein